MGEAPQQANEWQRRPLLSFGLRLTAFLGPILLSLGIVLLLGRMLPPAQNVLQSVLWFLVTAAASLLTLIAVERVARKLLPLAALLNVSLVFPNVAPRRLAIARSSGDSAELQHKLDSAKRRGHESDADAMQHVIDLLLAMSVHDRRTRGHCERVRRYADMIAAELKLSPEARAKLPWAALLHDVGKLRVNTAILNKTGKPSAEEWEVLHRHPEEGHRIIAPLLPWLGEWGYGVVQHHERWDGTGYPRGLAGEEISLAARIVAVADTYEVITAARAYKRPLSPATARKELTRVAGTQLDPAVVRAFLNVSLKRLWTTITLGAVTGQVPSLAQLLSTLARLGSMAAQGAAVAMTASALAVTGIAGPSLATAPSAPIAASAYSAQGGSVAGPTGGAHPGQPGKPGQPGHSGAAAPSGIALPGESVGSSPAPSSAAPQPSGGSVTPNPGPTSGPTSGPTPGPGGTPTPGPVTTPTPGPTPGPTSGPTPGPTATPTPIPTPMPTPDPWSCAGCTNSSNGCTSYCSNNNATACLDHCVGNNNRACLQYCFGNNNRLCTNYCWGSNNKQCITNCRDTNYQAPGSGVAQQGLSSALGVAAVLLLTPRLWWRRGRNRAPSAHGDSEWPPSCPCGG